MEEALCCGNELVNELKREKEKNVSCENQLSIHRTELQMVLVKEKEWVQERHCLNDMQNTLTSNLNSLRAKLEHLRVENDETNENLRYQQSEVERLRIKLSVAESDLIISKENCGYLKLTAIQRDSELQLLATQYTKMVNGNSAVSSQIEQLKEDKKNLEESLFKLKRNLANVENEKMLMQREQGKLLHDKSDEEEIIADDIKVISSLKEKLTEKDIILQNMQTAFADLLNGYREVKQELPMRSTEVNKKTNVDVWTQFNTSDHSLLNETKYLDRCAGSTEHKNDIEVITSLKETLMEKDIILQNMKSAFAELLRGYKQIKVEYAMRSTEVNKKTNTSDRFLNETKYSDGWNDLSKQLSIGSSEHKEKLNNLRKCNWERCVSAMVSAKNKYMLQRWNDSTHCSTMVKTNDKDNFIIDSLQRAFEEIEGLKKNNGILLVDKSVYEIENRKLIGNVDDLKGKLTQLTFELNNSRDTDKDMTTMTKANRKLTKQLTDSENGKVELENNVQNLHNDITRVKENSANWKKRAKIFFADKEKLKREMSERVSQLEKEVDYYKPLEIKCQHLEKIFSNQKQMRLEDSNEYEKMKRELNHFKMLISKYESNLQNDEETTCYGKREKESDTPAINLHLHVDPIHNNSGKEGIENSNIDMYEVKREVKEMLRNNFEKYKPMIDKIEIKNLEIQQRKNGELYSKIINETKLKKLKRKLRAEIKVLEEKCITLQTIVSSSEIHCHMRSSDIERESMNEQQQVKFDELEMKIHDVEDNIKLMANQKTMSPLNLTINRGDTIKTRHSKMIDLQQTLAKCKVKIDKIGSFDDIDISEDTQKDDAEGEIIIPQLQGDIKVLKEKVDEVHNILSSLEERQDHRKKLGTVEKTLTNLKQKVSAVQNALKSCHQGGEQKHGIYQLETTITDLNQNLSNIEKRIELISISKHQNVNKVDNNKPVNDMVNKNIECDLIKNNDVKLNSKSTQCQLPIESQEIHEKSQISKLEKLVEDLQENNHTLTKQKNELDQEVELLKWKENIQETVTHDEIEFEKSETSELKQVVKDLQDNNDSLTEKNDKLDSEVKLLKWEKNIQNTVTIDLHKKIIALKADISEQEETIVSLDLQMKDKDDVISEASK